MTITGMLRRTPFFKRGAHIRIQYDDKGQGSGVFDVHVVSIAYATKTDVPIVVTEEYGPLRIFPTTEITLLG